MLEEAWRAAGVTCGDLVFFARIPSVKPGDFEKAVLDSSKRGKSYFHVGVVASAHSSQPEHLGTRSSSQNPWNENLRVVHAVQNGVLLQTIEEAIDEVSPDELHVYHVDVEQHFREAAIAFCLSKIGCAYNDVFSKECLDSKGKEAFYCSQLVTEAYKGAPVGFPPHSMNFSGPDGQVLEYWKKYYGERGREIPIGEEGSHPDQLVEGKALKMMASMRVSKGFAVPEGIQQTLSYIGGVATSLHGGQEFEVVRPRDGKVVAKCASTTPEQVNEVVNVAKKAQEEWANKTWLERGSVLRRTAQLIREQVEAISVLECEDNGKPLWEARMDVASCADTFDFYAGVGQNLAGSHFPLDNSRFAYTRREPLGVVGCVGAWNYPLQTCSWKTAPALACGNSVVYKPSPLAPVTATLLGHILTAAGLPWGVYNVIQGEGETGRALVEHPLINKVSFTGSVQTGKAIMQACANRSVKPVTLELGGKSALIILDDADLQSAVAGAMIANFFSQGQVCSNASKVLVHRSLLREFTDELVHRTRAMKIGNPLEEDTRVGAAISRQHLERVKQFIDGAVAAGARCLYGGEKVTVAGQEGGFYLSPCILTDIREDMDVYKNEIFGSVLLILPFDDEKEALRMANDTTNRLAAGVFTKNLAKAHSFAAKLQAGNVYVNTYNDVSPFVPFGGIGDAGFGRENGIQSLEHYTQTKSVFVNTDETLLNPF